MEKSKLSFITTRVDSLDMVASNVRIVDDMGQTATSGRLEVRQKGDWKTVCANSAGNSNNTQLFDKVASVACAELK